MATTRVCSSECLSRSFQYLLKTKHKIKPISKSIVASIYLSRWSTTSIVCYSRSDTTDKLVHNTFNTEATLANKAACLSAQSRPQQPSNRTSWLFVSPLAILTIIISRFIQKAFASNAVIAAKNLTFGFDLIDACSETKRRLILDISSRRGDAFEFFSATNGCRAAHCQTLHCKQMQFYIRLTVLNVFLKNTKMLLICHVYWRQLSTKTDSL